MKGMKAELRATANCFGMKFWEVDAIKDGKRIASVYIFLSHLKERGVTKSLTGKRKMLDWINGTYEGQEYLKKRVEEDTEKWRKLAEGAASRLNNLGEAGGRKGLGGTDHD